MIKILEYLRGAGAIAARTAAAAWRAVLKVFAYGRGAAPPGLLAATLPLQLLSRNGLLAIAIVGLLLAQAWVWRQGYKSGSERATKAIERTTEIRNDKSRKAQRSVDDRTANDWLRKFWCRDC